MNSNVKTHNRLMIFNIKDEEVLKYKAYKQ